MSTPSGLGGKGEKNKAKYQQLNINTIYKGRSAETQKTVQRQHGLQSLGKVAIARRMPPPANLPSLKLENSGNDPAVTIVPSGGNGGWVKKEASSAASETNTVPDGHQPLLQQQQPRQLSLQPSAAAAPVTTQNSIGMSNGANAASTGSRSWSSVTQGASALRGGDLAGQDSPRFQREFPTLGDDAGGAGVSSENARRADGLALNLRPQNVGSWREGGGGGRSTAASAPSASDGSLTSDVQEGRRREGAGEDYWESSSNRSGSLSGAARSVTLSSEVAASQRYRGTSSKEEESGRRPEKRDEFFGKSEASDGGWASITGEVDYSAKLNFSDDEEGEETAKSSRPEDARKQQAQPSKLKATPDPGASKDAAVSKVDRGEPPGAPKEAWAAGQMHPAAAYPMPAAMHYEMWQRMPPGRPFPGMRPPYGMQRFPLMPQAFGGQRLVSPVLPRNGDLTDEGEHYNRQRQQQIDTARIIERGRQKREEAERAAAASKSGANNNDVPVKEVTDGVNHAVSKEVHIDTENGDSYARKVVPPRFQQPGSSPPPRSQAPAASPSPMIMQPPRQPAYWTMPSHWHLHPSQMIRMSGQGVEATSDSHPPRNAASAGTGANVDYPYDYAMAEMFYQWIQQFHPPLPPDRRPQLPASLATQVNPAMDDRRAGAPEAAVPTLPPQSDGAVTVPRAVARRVDGEVPIIPSSPGNSGASEKPIPQTVDHAPDDPDKEMPSSSRSDKKPAQRVADGSVRQEKASDASCRGVLRSSAESSLNIDDGGSAKAEHDFIKEDRGPRRSRRPSKQQGSLQPRYVDQEPIGRKRPDSTAPPPIPREAQKSVDDVRSKMVTLKRKSNQSTGLSTSTPGTDRKSESPKPPRSPSVTVVSSAGQLNEHPQLPQKAAWQKIVQAPAADIKKELKEKVAPEQRSEPADANYDAKIEPPALEAGVPTMSNVQPAKASPQVNVEEKPPNKKPRDGRLYSTDYPAHGYSDYRPNHTRGREFVRGARRGLDRGRGTYGGSRSRGGNNYDGFDVPLNKNSQYVDANHDSIRKDRRYQQPTGAGTCRVSDNTTDNQQTQNSVVCSPEFSSRQPPAHAHSRQVAVTGDAEVSGAGIQTSLGSVEPISAGSVIPVCSGSAPLDDVATENSPDNKRTNIVKEDACLPATDTAAGRTSVAQKEDNVWDRRLLERQTHPRRERDRQSQDYYDVRNRPRGRGGRGMSFRRSGRQHDNRSNNTSDELTNSKEQGAAAQAFTTSGSLPVETRTESQPSDRPPMKPVRKPDYKHERDPDGPFGDHTDGSRDYDRSRRYEGRRQSAYDHRELRRRGREYYEPGPYKRSDDNQPGPANQQSADACTDDDGTKRYQNETSQLQAERQSQYQGSGRRRGSTRRGSPRGNERHGWPSTDGGRNVHYPARFRGSVNRGRGRAHDRSRATEQHAVTSPKAVTSAGAAGAIPKRLSMRRDSGTDNAGEQEEWETASESSDHIREGKRDSEPNGPGKRIAAVNQGERRPLDNRKTDNKRPNERSPVKHKTQAPAKNSDLFAPGTRGKRNSHLADQSNYVKTEKERRNEAIAKIDLSNIAGVVVIDDASSKNMDDDNGWQDEEGFHVVTSRKRQKQKAQEAAAAAAAEAQRRKRSEAAKSGITHDASRQENTKVSSSVLARVSAGSSCVTGDSRNNRNKLPPRLAKQKEEKMKKSISNSSDNFKIDQWGQDGALANGKTMPSASTLVIPADFNIEASAQINATASSRSDDREAAVTEASTSGPDQVAINTAISSQPQSSNQPSVAAGVPGPSSESAVTVPVAKTRTAVKALVASEKKAIIATTAVQLPAFSGPENSDPRIKFAFDVDSARVAESEERAAAAAAAAVVVTVASTQAPSSLSTKHANAPALSAAADLNQKIDSVKTLWDAPPASGSSSGLSSTHETPYSPPTSRETAVSAPASAYPVSPAPVATVTSSEQSNVCMVKPQLAGSVTLLPSVSSGSNASDQDGTSGTAAVVSTSSVGGSAVPNPFYHSSFRPAEQLGLCFPVVPHHIHSSSVPATGAATPQQQLDQVTVANRDGTALEHLSPPSSTISAASNDQLYHRALAPGSGGSSTYHVGAQQQLLGQRPLQPAIVPGSAPGSVAVSLKHSAFGPTFAPLGKGMPPYEQHQGGSSGGMCQQPPLYMHFEPSGQGSIADIQAVRSSATGSMLPVQSMASAGSTGGSPQPAANIGPPYQMALRHPASGNGTIFAQVAPGQQPSSAPANMPAAAFYQQQQQGPFAVFPSGNQPPLQLAVPLANIGNPAQFGTAGAVSSGGGGLPIGSLIGAGWSSPASSQTNGKMKGNALQGNAFQMNGSSLAASPFVGSCDMAHSSQWSIGQDKPPVARRQAQQHLPQQQHQNFGQQQHPSFNQQQNYGQPQQQQQGFGQQQGFSQQLMMPSQLATGQQPQQQHRHAAVSANFVRQQMLMGGVRPAGPRPGFVPRTVTNTTHATSATVYPVPIQRPQPSASAPGHVATGNGGINTGSPTGRTQKAAQTSKPFKGKTAEDAAARAEKAKQRADLIKHTQDFLNPTESKEDVHPQPSLSSSEEPSMCESHSTDSPLHAEDLPLATNQNVAGDAASSSVTIGGTIETDPTSVEQ